MLYRRFPPDDSRLNGFTVAPGDSRLNGYVKLAESCKKYRIYDDNVSTLVA